MIQNNSELGVTKDRIAYFLRLLAELRVTSRPDEFPLVASGYRAEVERMQKEVLDYLTRHASGVSLPEWHQRELERRRAAAEADLGAGEPWEAVKTRLARRP